MTKLDALVAVADLRERRFVVDAVQASSNLRLLSVGSDLDAADRRAAGRRPRVILVSIARLDPVGRARLREFAGKGDEQAMIIDVDFAPESPDIRGSLAPDRRKVLRLRPGDLKAPDAEERFLQSLQSAVRQLAESNSSHIPEVKSFRRHLIDPIELICIGSSTGGPDALDAVLGRLPADLRAPVMVTQHIPGHFVDSLVERLNRGSALEVRVAQDGETVRPGHVYVAPGERHMLISEFGVLKIELADFGPVQSCRPAVDPMFASCARLGKRVIGVILTGMGIDGLDGAKALRNRGAEIIAQDEASSSVWGMPGAVAKAGLASDILPLNQIADAITARVGRGQPEGVTS